MWILSYMTQLIPSVNHTQEKQPTLIPSRFIPSKLSLVLLVLHLYLWNFEQPSCINSSVHSGLVPLSLSQLTHRLNMFCMSKQFCIIHQKETLRVFLWDCRIQFKKEFITNSSMLIECVHIYIVIRKAYDFLICRSNAVNNLTINRHSHFVQMWKWNCLENKFYSVTFCKKSKH